MYIQVALLSDKFFLRVSFSACGEKLLTIVGFQIGVKKKQKENLENVQESKYVLCRFIYLAESSWLSAGTRRPRP